MEFITVWGGIYGWERLKGCHFASTHLEKGVQIMIASLLMIVGLVGASLSEPRTSVTALRTCVSVYLSMD